MSQLETCLSNINQNVFGQSSKLSWTYIDGEMRTFEEHLSGVIINDLYQDNEAENRQKRPNGKRLYGYDLIEASKQAVRDKGMSRIQKLEDLYDVLKTHNVNSHGGDISTQERERLGQKNTLEALTYLKDLLSNDLTAISEFSNTFRERIRMVGQRLSILWEHLRQPQYSKEICEKCTGILTREFGSDSFPERTGWNYILIAPAVSNHEEARNVLALSGIDWQVVCDPNHEDGCLFIDALASMGGRINNVNVTEDVSEQRLNWFFVDGRKNGDSRSQINNTVRRLKNKLSRRNLLVVDLLGNKEVVCRFLSYLWQMSAGDDEEALCQSTWVFTSKKELLKSKLKEEGYNGVQVVGMDVEPFEMLKISLVNRKIPNIIDFAQGPMSVAQRSACSSVGIFFLDSDETVSLDTSSTDHPFYKGCMITINELKAQDDVYPRGDGGIYNDFVSDIKKALIDLSSQAFKIVQNPGAGGTTYARRLAFDIVSQNNKVSVLPVFIQRYVPDDTVKMLEKLCISSGNIRPILLVADDKEIRVSDLDTIRNEMQKGGRDIVTLYLTHSLDILRFEKNGNTITLPSHLKKKELQLFESKFHTAYSRLLTDEQIQEVKDNIKNAPDGTPLEQVEMIAYPYSFSEKAGVSTEKLLSTVAYVEKWLGSLSDRRLKNICGYTAFVYRFTAARPLSLLSIEKVWRTTVGLTLEQTYGEEDLGVLFRLLKRTAGQGESERYSLLMIPRYGAFAESILKGWRQDWMASLAEISLDFVDSLPLMLEQSEKDLLVDLFIQQSKNDYRIQDESCERRINFHERFSLLVGEVLKGKQGFENASLIFAKLIDRYPGDFFFKLHYARLLFEYAKENKTSLDDESLTMAGQLIDEVLDDEKGQKLDDSYHIKGMYWRRMAELLMKHHTQESDASETESTLISYVDRSLAAFDECNEINHGTSPYGYISASQLLQFAIRSLSRLRKRKISDPQFVDDEPVSSYIDKFSEILSRLENLDSQHSVDEKTIRNQKDFYFSLIGKDEVSIRNYMVKLDSLLDGYEKKFYTHRLIMVTRYFYSQKFGGRRGAYTNLKDDFLQAYETNLRVLIDEYDDLRSCEELFNLYRYRSHEPIGRGKADSALNRWEECALKNKDSASLLRAYYFKYVSYAVRLLDSGVPNAEINKQYLNYRDKCRELSKALLEYRYGVKLWLISEYGGTWSSVRDYEECVIRQSEKITYAPNTRRISALVININDNQCDCESGRLTKISFTLKGLNIGPDDKGVSFVEGYLGFRLNGPGLYGTKVLDKVPQREANGDISNVDNSDNTTKTTLNGTERGTDKLLNQIAHSDSSTIQATHTSKKEEIFRLEKPKLSGLNIIGKISAEELARRCAKK